MKGTSEDIRRTQLEYALGARFSDGNQVEVLRNGVEIFPAMLEAIASARESVDLVTFVYWTGDIARRFGDALSRKADEGIRVRVVLDAFGARRMPRDLVARMRQSGVEVRWFRPFRLLHPWQFDKRTHRKILVVDASVGFTGGVGIATQWEGDARSPSEWRDTHLRISGPAVIGLHAAFLDNWNECGPWQWRPVSARVPERDDGVSIQIIRASSTVGWTESAAMLRSLISSSNTEVRITTAYFVPDEILMDTMIKALGRGVRLIVLIAGKHHDSRVSQLAGQPSTQRLLEAGAECFQFEPTMLHAKVLTVDGVLSCIGSTNFNHRSMGKDEECCALLLCEQTAAVLNAQFDADCERATRLSAAGFGRRSFWTRLLERAARLVVEQL